MVIMSNQQDPSSLPPGFRFHPTDEELILHYLRNKSSSLPCPVSIIADVDIYKFDPWDLPGMAVYGDKEWYFFTPRDRKYPNGTRPNRATRSGYWKATGTDKPVVTKGSRVKIGVKKALVYYEGKPPKGRKTNWVMHEYRLDQYMNGNSSNIIHNNKKDDHSDFSMRLDEWVLCRIYEKINQSKYNCCPQSTVDGEGEQEPSRKNCIEEDLGLPDLSNQHRESIDSRLVKVASLTEIFRNADSDLYRILYNNSSSENQFSFQTNNCNGINISGVDPRSIRTEPSLTSEDNGVTDLEDISFHNNNNINNNDQLPIWNQYYVSQNQWFNGGVVYYS